VVLAVRRIRVPAAETGGEVIATELVEFTKRYFASKKIPVKVEFTGGRREVKPPRLPMRLWRSRRRVSCGEPLRIIETLMESETQLIANKAAYADAWEAAEDR